MHIVSIRKHERICTHLLRLLYVGLHIHISNNLNCNLPDVINEDKSWKLEPTRRLSSSFHFHTFEYVPSASGRAGTAVVPTLIMGRGSSRMLILLGRLRSVLDFLDGSPLDEDPSSDVPDSIVRIDQLDERELVVDVLCKDGVPAELSDLPVHCVGSLALFCVVEDVV